jgi:lipopolysaccharide transport system permease protein
MTVLAIAIGMWLSALNVKYRDVRYVLPFATQVGMFLTPIVYPLSLVPEKWRAVLALNPMTGIVEGFRACLLGSPLDLAVLSSSAVLTVALLVYGVYAFKRMERQIADVV